jgi:hypothetical protein
MMPLPGLITVAYSSKNRCIFLGILTKGAWLEFASVQFVTFREVGLAMESSDRAVWHYAQKHQMIMLTANRNMRSEMNPDFRTGS